MATTPLHNDLRPLSSPLHASRACAARPGLPHLPCSRSRRRHRTRRVESGVGEAVRPCRRRRPHWKRNPRRVAGLALFGHLGTIWNITIRPFAVKWCHMEPDPAGWGAESRSFPKHHPDRDHFKLLKRFDRPTTRHQTCHSHFAHLHTWHRQCSMLRSLGPRSGQCGACCSFRPGHWRICFRLGHWRVWAGDDLLGWRRGDLPRAFVAPQAFRMQGMLDSTWQGHAAKNETRQTAFATWSQVPVKCQPVIEQLDVLQSLQIRLHSFDPIPPHRNHHTSPHGPLRLLLLQQLHWPLLRQFLPQLSLQPRKKTLQARQAAAEHHAAQVRSPQLLRHRPHGGHHQLGHLALPSLKPPGKGRWLVSQLLQLQVSFGVWEPEIFRFGIPTLRYTWSLAFDSEGVARSIEEASHLVFVSKDATSSSWPTTRNKKLLGSKGHRY